MDILQIQLDARREKRSYALATIVKAGGATPRGAGSKMLVHADGSAQGSVGGGFLEKQVIADAVKCINARESFLHEYENRDGEDGAPCGGAITVFIEFCQGAPELVVCGAGHVGACVIRLASELGYHVTAVDTRDTATTAENVRQADKFVLADDFYGGIKALETGPGAFFLISTYGHAQDGEALAAALEKDAAYIGMMGSAAKIKALFAKLRERGFGEELLACVHTPIGLDIGGETPQEIAIAIVAEMQMTRYGGTGRPLKEI